MHLTITVAGYILMENISDFAARFPLIVFELHEHSKKTALGNFEQFEQFCHPIYRVKGINHLGSFCVFQINQTDAAGLFRISTAFFNAPRSI